jgi:hypothetical protein
MVKITFRFNDDQLHKAIAKTARKNHRSLNGEIERAIEFYLKEAPEAQYEVKPVEKEEPKKKSPK